MTDFSRRRLLGQGLGLGAALAAPAWSLAQDKYPSRSVRVVVPFAAGGTTDVVARAWCCKN